MEQEIFNWAVAVSGCLGGWVLKTIWDSLKDLQATDIKLSERVNEIDVLVAGRYVTRDEMNRSIDKIFAKLDQISGQLSEKADR